MNVLSTAFCRMIVRNTLGLMYIENLTSVALGSYMRPTMAQNESCNQSVAASRSFFENFWQVLCAFMNLQILVTRTKMFLYGNQNLLTVQFERAPWLNKQTNKQKNKSRKRKIKNRKRKSILRKSCKSLVAGNVY